jgi:hypothetical protein
MKFKPWHTPLLAIFPILTLFASNNQYVQLNDLWAPLAISFVAFIILASLLSIVFKSWIKGGLLTSLLAIMFYNYGLYQDFGHGNSIPFYPKNIQFDHNFYKWSCLILLLIVIWRLFKTNKPLKKLNSLVNLFAIVLVLMSTYRIAEYEFSRTSLKLEENLAELDSASVVLNPDRPTIYYLIMDAYTRNDILQEYFDYDNSDFTDFLKSEGFYVADKSISNYGQTVLSIPSSMNMMYMDSVISKIGPENGDRWPMAKVLNNSKLLRTLGQQEYKSVSYDASMFEVVYLKSADIFHTTPGTKLSLFQNELINTTAIRSFNRRRKIKTLSQEDYHRKKILNAFDHIGQIPSKLVPYYVHGHILAPHQPFLFDKDGNPKSMEGGYNIWSPLAPKSNNELYKKGYVGQLQYINKRLKELITKIIHESKRPAIIILQGDHGTASELRNHQGFENNDFKERFSIMNAYYFPDQDYSMLYPEISPVNSFKVVMNKYFDRDMKLEEDKAFYGNWDQPFNLIDVTEQVRK